MSSSNNNDATQFQPRPVSTAASESDDKTRFAPRANTVDAGAAAPKLDTSDATIAKPVARPAPSQNSAKPPAPDVSSSGGPAIPADATQFSPGRGKLPVAGSDDKTRITAVPADRQAAPTKQADNTPAENLLKNRFVFEEILGSGGMGIVYKAKDLLKVEAQDREPYVAIKVLGEEFKAHPEAFIALQRESRKTQRIAHPNIVNVHDFDRDGDTVFMTMEYMEGRPLDKLISQYRSTGLPPEDARFILEGISAALIYAHQQNIIHSDFKPGNIFVTDNGTAKVFDFGIARAVAKAESREENLDDKTVFDAGNLGALTPAYASLEMLEGMTPDVRDDVYALGCIAYEMHTGKHPYNRVHADEALRQKLKPSRIPGLSRNEWKAIESAIAFKREDRVASVEEFLRKFQQKPSHTFAIVAVVVALLAATGYGIYKAWPEPPAPVNDGEMRSEIEHQLRVEMRMQSLTGLMASASFTEEWENQVWSDVQSLREDLGDGDPWLVPSEANIYKLYLDRIESSIAEEKLDFARRLLTNAGRYAGEGAEELPALVASLKDKEAEIKRRAVSRRKQAELAEAAQEQEAKAAAEEERRKSLFDRALANVEKLLDCRNNLEMEDFEIALGKLKSVSAQQYTAQEPRIMRSMGECIRRIGEYYPDRAEAVKQRAMTIFNGHRLIADVRIVPKDSCSESIAGLGSSGMRATCRDLLKDNSRGPVLVVAPASAQLPAFAIGKYEVTNGEYAEYCRQASNCQNSPAGDPAAPVVDITVQDAHGYLRWLSDQTGKTYRLPTLQEWRHAAHAGTGATDPNRNCKLSSRGITRGNALLRTNIGQQNAWGLVNYLGNAREWVMGRGGETLVAGGSYESPMDECSLASRAPHAGAADQLTGLRVLREMVRP
jgi:serine/threonine protein kinase